MSTLVNQVYSVCGVHDEEQVESNLTAEKVARLQRRRQCPGSAILELVQLRSNIVALQLFHTMSQ